MDYDLLVTGGTYVDGVKYSELYNLLTYSTIRDNDLDRYVDGGKLLDGAVVIKVDPDAEGNNTNHATMTGLAKDRDYVEAFALSSTNTTTIGKGGITTNGELTADDTTNATLLLGIKDKDGAIVAMKPSVITHVRAGAEIRVQMVSSVASDALNAALTNAAGTKMEVVKKPSQSDTTTGTGAVYKITVNSDIAAMGTFTAALQVKTPAIELASDITIAGTSSPSAVIAPTSYDTDKMKLTFTPVSEDNEDAISVDVSKVAVTWGESADAGKIMFSNGSEITKEDDAVIGTVTVEAEGPNGEVWATVINVAFSA